MKHTSIVVQTKKVQWKNKNVCTITLVKEAAPVMVEAHTNIDGAMNKYWSKQNLCAASGAAAPSGHHSFDAASSC